MAESKPTRAARRLVAKRCKRFFDLLVAELGHGADEIWKKVVARAQTAELERQPSADGHRLRHDL